MAAAAGGMVFINGLGAVTGPLITGWLMGVMGPQGFFVVIAVLSLSTSAYAAYRMTQRAAPAPEDTDSYMAVAPSASPMAVEFAQEVAIETAQEGEEAPKQG
jgi:MFS family permease